MNNHSIPYVLTIAGHDPCAGAGLTADIKTFEKHKVYGMSVATAITVQNDKEFIASYNIDIAIILQQIENLYQCYNIEVVKIGLISHFNDLKKIVLKLKSLNPDVKIIWDPIIKSSSGFSFHQELNIENDLLKHLFLITPNFTEYKTFEENGVDLSKYPCLLKGGHNKQKPGIDILMLNNEHSEIEGIPFNGKSKHGTGCVLSAAIAANIAHGMNILQACINAKKYVEQFILSSEGNLGLHQNI